MRPTYEKRPIWPCSSSISSMSAITHANESYHTCEKVLYTDLWAMHEFRCIWPCSGGISLTCAVTWDLKLCICNQTYVCYFAYEIWNICMWKMTYLVIVTEQFGVCEKRRIWPCLGGIESTSALAWETTYSRWDICTSYAIWDVEDLYVKRNLFGLARAAFPRCLQSTCPAFAWSIPCLCWCVCVRVCIYMYIYTYMYICIYLCIHTHIHIYAYTYAYVCIHIYKYVHIHMYMYKYVCICICKNIYVYIYIYMYIYVYIHIHAHTHKHRHGIDKADAWHVDCRHRWNAARARPNRFLFTYRSSTSHMRYDI